MKISNNIYQEGIKEFLNNHPKTTIFQTPEMYEVYKRTKNYTPIFLSVKYNNNELVGILLAVIQKEHKGPLGILSARSIILGGPIIKDHNTDVLDFVLYEYSKKIENRAIYSQFRNMWKWNKDEVEVFKKYGFMVEPHLDIIHDLTKPIDIIWMNLHKGRRKNIRRIERADVIFREINDEDEFKQAYQLIIDTYNRVKLPMPDYSLFEASYKKLATKNILKIFVAEHCDELIATRMVLCYNSLIYDWYAGTSEKHIAQYPNDYLPWKIMEWGNINKFKIFDFGGAGKPERPYGVREHKLKFGGDLVEYGRFERIHKTALFQLGKIGLQLYKVIGKSRT